MALSRCNYLNWGFHRLQSKIDYHLSLQDHNTHTRAHMDKDSKINNIYMVVPTPKAWVKASGMSAAPSEIF